MGQVTADVSTKQGIHLWRYQAPNSYLANATENPDNIGFCTPQSRCLGSGIYNASVCQLGIILSFAVLEENAEILL